MIKTANFNPQSDPKLLCTCGHPDCDRRSVDQFSLDRAQRMREDFGRPMLVNSAGRCPHHPNEVHKSAPGDHALCRAIDFACDNALDETRIKVLAGRFGATRVAGTWRDGFVHVAWTETDRTDVPTWGY